MWSEFWYSGRVASAIVALIGPYGDQPSPVLSQVMNSFAIRLSSGLFFWGFFEELCDPRLRFG